MKRIINIDMDGVVADFNAYTSEVLGRKIGWEGRDLSAGEWIVLGSIDRLYYKLPLIEESRELVALALSRDDCDVRFLTAIPRRTTMPTAEQDKRDWLGVYFPGIACEIGPYSKDKQKWCKPGDILIDDKLSNVEEWCSAGGVAVYHLGNWSETLTNLRFAFNIKSPTILGLVA